MIIPVKSGAHPDHELPKPQPPTGGGKPPRPDHTLPGQLPHPEHPIFYPLPPGAPVDPEYGVPIDGPYPDQGLPGSQPHPDQGLPKPPAGGAPPKPDQGLPPHPSHPIVLPPDGGGGWAPIFIWGPTDPRPTPPIHIPPDGPSPIPELPGKIEWEAVWTPDNGWQTIGVITPDKPLPTPSKK